jgi:hypothetical protein
VRTVKSPGTRQELRKTAPTQALAATERFILVVILRLFWWVDFPREEFEWRLSGSAANHASDHETIPCRFPEEIRQGKRSQFAGLNMNAR